MRAPKVYWRWFRWQVVKDGWEPTDTGWVLTVAIIWMVSWIAYPIREGEGQSKLAEFLKLRPSEMGDTLAGVFSALAFVWIIVTVFMQSRELREQRVEFKQQRLATQDMARAMTAQAAIFEDEREHRQQEKAGGLLSERARSVVDMTNFYRNVFFVSFEVEDCDLSDLAGLITLTANDPTRGDIWFFREEYTDADMVRNLQAIAVDTFAVKDSLETILEHDHEISSKARNRHRFLEIITKIEEALDLSAELSSSQQERLTRYRLAHTMGSLKGISNMKIWVEEETE